MDSTMCMIHCGCQKLLEETLEEIAPVRLLKPEDMDCAMATSGTQQWGLHPHRAEG